LSIGIGALIAGIVYILLAKKIEREKSEPEVLRQIRSEVNQMIVELNQTADRNIGLVEQRIETLNHLLERTDRKIKLLQRESDRYSQSLDTYSRMKPKIVKPPAGIGSGPTFFSSHEEGSAPSHKQDNPEKKDRKNMILELFKQGISPDLIASRVNSTVAEVELIISIHEEKEE